MIVQDKAISDIKPYQKNPRHKYDINKVAQSIKEFGFQQPIVVDRAGVIIVGHGRYEAAKSLNLKTIPVTIADLSPEKAKAYRIADNKTNEYSDWDMGLLIQEFTDLLDNNYDLELTGFDSDELEKLIVGEKDGLTDEDAVPETPEEPKAQLGDIYKLGKHKIICGDSTELNFYEKLLENHKIDLLITDPPYNVDYEGKTKEKLKIENDKKNDEEFQKFLDDFTFNTFEFMKGGASYYIFHADVNGLSFRQSLKNNNIQLRQNLIWVKNSMVMGRQDYQWKHEPILYGWKNGESHSWYSDRKQTTLINYDRPTKSKLHPTMKPVGLIEYLIKNSSKSEDIVFDSFLGSGSTLLACEKNNRICYGIEFDPKYVDVIVKRWEQYTGNKAEKIN